MKRAYEGEQSALATAHTDFAPMGFAFDIPSEVFDMGVMLSGGLLGKLVFEHAAAERVIVVTEARSLASPRLLERAGMLRIESHNAIFREEPCVEYTYVISHHRHGEPRRFARFRAASVCPRRLSDQEFL